MVCHAKLMWPPSISFTAQRWDEDPELKSFVKAAEPTGRQLGAGAYGSVEQVSIEGEMYAAKKLTVKICMNPNEFYKKFFSEFRILSSLCHPNIVQYQCVCPLPNSESPALVMEQMQTNLHDYLLNPSYANLPLSAKVSLLQDDLPRGSPLGFEWYSQSLDVSLKLV